MWSQIYSSVSDCKVALDGLDTIILKIDGGAGSQSTPRLLRKPSMQLKVMTHSKEIAEFTTRIYRSNCAMQTALAVVNV